MNYNVDYFIKKLSGIPQDLWTIEHAHKDGKSCALGHCGMGQREGKDLEMIRELFKGVYVKIKTYSHTNSYKIGEYANGGMAIAAINNGHTEEYQQPTPKQRILAALYDIKKLQQQEDSRGRVSYENISHELAVLPISETSDQPIKEVVNN